MQVSLRSSAIDGDSAYLYFLSQHDQLPLCGIPEYIREYTWNARGYQSDLNNLHCYYEGDRELCTTQYAVCRCEKDLHIIDNLPSDVLFHCNDMLTDNAKFGVTIESPRDCVLISAESNGYSLQ